MKKTIKKAKKSSFKPNFYTLMKNFYAHLCKRYFFVSISFVLFSFSVFSDHEEHCDILMSWKLPVCGSTVEERTYKSNALSQQLAESLTRKKMIPKKVMKAAESVFSIGLQNTFREWSWNFEGGSGFFFFNNQTFVSAYHVLEFLEENILHWSEVAFNDLDGNRHDFKIKGIKFASKLLDIVVFEVEGYKGLVLELSTELPGEQSYAIGYPKSDFEIRSVGYTFEATDIYYGSFIELFDCYYGYYFNGTSGGPLVNKEGRVEGVSSAVTSTPQPFDCGFFVTVKAGFLIKVAKTTARYHSIDEVRGFMLVEKMRITMLAMEGNMDAKFELMREQGSVSMESDAMEDTTSHHPLMQHLLMLELIKFKEMEAIGNSLIGEMEELEKMMGGLGDPELGEIIDSFNNSLSRATLSQMYEWMTTDKSQHFLPVTWYEIGVAAYFIDNNLEKACTFWDKARQTGHPFILSEFVIIPKMDVVRCEF